MSVEIVQIQGLTLTSFKTRLCRRLTKKLVEVTLTNTALLPLDPSDFNRPLRKRSRPGEKNKLASMDHATRTDLNACVDDE